MKIMISVGEASGDMHGAGVAAALRELNPAAQLVGMGGKAMREAGVNIIYDIENLGVIGIVEVVKNLRRLFRLRDFLVEYMKKEKPDILLIIDYPGFNVKLAEEARRLGIPVVSYIAPSAWAWGKGRAKKLAGIVDRVAAIFPFEAAVYREAGAKVTFVGHPLLDIVKPTMSKVDALKYFGTTDGETKILLMPGSRSQEILNLLPDMLGAAQEIAKTNSGCRFYLPLASTITREMLAEHIDKYDIDVTVTTDNTYDLMNICDLAIAGSGTATLETSLMRLPTVIVYRVATLTYYIARLLVKIPDIGLPNIVAGRRIVPELVQDMVTPQAIAAAAVPLLNDPSVREETLRNLDEVRERLGEAGAVKRVAQVVIEVMSGSVKAI